MLGNKRIKETPKRHCIANAGLLAFSFWVIAILPSTAEEGKPSITLCDKEIQSRVLHAVPSDHLFEEQTTADWILPPNDKRLTVALALGGGGIRGAAHIGVLRAFEKANLPIDFIAGTSMGSFVGGLYAAGVPLEKIEEAILNKHKVRRACFPCPIALKVTLMAPNYLFTGLKNSFVGTFKGNRIARLVEHLTLRETQNIEDCQIKFVAMTSNLVDGKVYAISGGPLGQAIQASCTVPFLYRPVQTSDGKLFVDGGLRANVPAYAAKLSGAKVVIAINVDEQLQEIDKQDLKGIFGLLNRTTTMLLTDGNDKQMKYADFAIIPKMPKISLYSHKLNDAREAISAGESAANEIIPKIKSMMRSMVRL